MSKNVTNTKKRIEVKIYDPKFTISEMLAGEYPTILPCECPNIMDKFKGRAISGNDVAESMDLIIAYLVRENSYVIDYVVAEREASLAPEKEMTISDIEKELGYRIKIIKENK